MRRKSPISSLTERSRLSHSTRKDARTEDVVTLDAKGQGTASLSFDAAAGNLRVVVGPEDATAEQMRALQTISVDVTRRQWEGKAELTLAPILISSYYWWWWWRWCRRFKNHGRRSLRRRESGAGRHRLRVQRGLVVVVVEQSAGRMRDDRRERRLQNRLHVVLRLVALVVVGASRVVRRTQSRRPRLAPAQAGTENQVFRFPGLSRTWRSFERCWVRRPRRPGPPAAQSGRQC